MSEELAVTKKCGSKQCPNCHEHSGARKILCDCGWNFKTNQLDEKGLAEKNQKPVEIFFKEEGKGRKKCPTCSKIVSGRLEKCYCGFDFKAAKNEKDVLKEQKKAEKKAKKENKSEKKVSKEVEETLKEMKDFVYEAPARSTSREHAERILAEGKEYASLKYHQAMKLKCWGHVDWKFVKEQLGIVDENVIKENKEENLNEEIKGE